MHHKAMQKPTIEVHDKYINIVGTNNDKVKYYTTASELLPKVPDFESKIKTVDWALKFQLTADKLAVIFKMVSTMKSKSKYLFFETDGKAIRLTIGNELESSGNNYDIVITDGITANKATKVIKIPLVDFKILEGEYEVRVDERITVWTNLSGVEYYISTAN
jgi:hypothetical protein